MNRTVTISKWKVPNANSTEQFFLDLARSNDDIKNLLPFLYKNFASNSGKYIQGFDGLIIDTKYEDMNIISEALWVKFDPEWVSSKILKSHWDSIIKAICLIEEFKKYSDDFLDDYEKDDGEEANEDDLLWVRLFSRFEVIIELFKKSVRHLSSIPHPLNYKSLIHLSLFHGWNIPNLFENQFGFKGTAFCHQSRAELYANEGKIIFSHRVNNKGELCFQSPNLYLIEDCKILRVNLLEFQQVGLGCIEFTISDEIFNSIVRLMKTYNDPGENFHPKVICFDDDLMSADGAIISKGEGLKSCRIKKPFTLESVICRDSNINKILIRFVNKMFQSKPVNLREYELKPIFASKNSKKEGHSNPKAPRSLVDKIWDENKPGSFFEYAFDYKLNDGEASVSLKQETVLLIFCPPFN